MTQIKNLDQLKQEFKYADVLETYINLGGIRSSKTISYDPINGEWEIENEIDGSYQVLTDEELWTKSNIGKAIDNNNFYIY